MRQSARCRSRIVSDIHAHPQAWRRTSEDMPSVDMVLCAGDAISEYRFWAETVDLLGQAQVHYIQGNHETGFFGGRNPDYLRKCLREFASELFDFLASAPLSLEFEGMGAKVLMADRPLCTAPLRCGDFRSYACAHGASGEQGDSRESRLVLSATPSGPGRIVWHPRPGSSECGIAWSPVTLSRRSWLNAMLQ